MRRFDCLLALGLLLPGCATAASEDRRAYILAHPHGWVEIAIEEGKTHEIVFDGETLAVRAPRPNEVVTLEDVYEAITGRRSPGN